MPSRTLEFTPTLQTSTATRFNSTSSSASDTMFKGVKPRPSRPFAPATISASSSTASSSISSCPRIPGSGAATCCASCDADSISDVDELTQRHLPRQTPSSTSSSSAWNLSFTSSSTSSSSSSPFSLSSDNKASVMEPYMSSNAPSIDEDSDYRISKVSSMSALSASSVIRRNNLRDRRRIAKHLMLLLTITSYLTSVLTLTSPPTITRQPRRHEVTYDSRENIHLECEADPKGDPKPTYSWTQNGVEIDFAANPRYAMLPGTGNFDIINPTESDQGYFQCRASNSHGVALTNVIHLREAFIDQMPKVTQPEVRKVGIGRHVTLKCTPPAALPKPDIFWTYGGGDESEFEAVHLSKRVTIDHDGNLHFINVEDIDDNDGQAYSCNVFNPVLKSIQQGYDQVIEINQNDVGSSSEPELMWSTTINTVAMKDSKLKLKCIFAGNPTPEITWKKVIGSELPEKRTRFTSFNQELQIRRVEFADQGQYECTASNGIGSPKSRVITVQVQSKPFFTVKPIDVNGNEEETYEIICKANGNPPPEVKLYRNGVPIEDVDLNSTKYSISPGKIVINGLAKDEDTAVFQCNATNANGYVFADAYLNVMAEPPMFTLKPDPELRVTEGTDAKLTCHTFGAPKPKIMWARNGAQLTGTRYEFKDIGDLVIKNVQDKEDEGVYTCIAHNKFGDISAQGSVKVFSRTEIKIVPESITERAGQGAGFKCKAEGDADLNLTIEWRKDGALLEEDGRIKIKASKNVLQHAESSVVISDVSDSDSGVYKCVAKTELDNTEEEAELTVQDVPQAPERPSIIHCRSREVLLEWSPGSDGRSPILNYIVQSNNSYSPDDWKNVDTDIDSETLQHPVDLSPWANYTFRIFARNKLGVSPPSEISAVCATPDDTPDRNPKEVKGEGRSPTDMVISWEPMSKIERNGPGFHYIVKYRRKDEDPTPDWVKMKISNPMQSEMTIPNTDTYVPYDIMVIAWNDNGSSKEPDTMQTGWSGEAMPTHAPEDFRCDEPSTPTTTHCTWKPVPEETIQGSPAGYKIQMWVEDEGESTMEEQVFPFNIAEGSVTLLKPYSSMVLQIRVRNSLYESDPSTPVTVVTPEGRPGPIQIMRAIPQGSDQFKITWNKPKEPNGELHGYRLSYQEVNGLELGEEIQYSESISPSATGLRLTDLKENTKYRISVKAYTSVGEGKDYFVEETTTVLTPPDTAYFEIHQVSDKMMNITVKPANSENPGIDFYVEFKAYTDDIWRRVRVDDPESTPFVELKGLEPGTSYIVRVVASNGPQSMNNSPEQLIVTSGEDSPATIICLSGLHACEPTVINKEEEKEGEEDGVTEEEDEEEDEGVIVAGVTKEGEDGKERQKEGDEDEEGRRGEDGMEEGEDEEEAEEEVIVAGATKEGEDGEEKQKEDKEDEKEEEEDETEVVVLGLGQEGRQPGKDGEGDTDGEEDGDSIAGGGKDGGEEKDGRDAIVGGEEGDGEKERGEGEGTDEAAIGGKEGEGNGEEDGEKDGGAVVVIGQDGDGGEDVAEGGDRDGDEGDDATVLGGGQEGDDGDVAGKGQDGEDDREDERVAGVLGGQKSDEDHDNSDGAVGGTGGDDGDVVVIVKQPDGGEGDKEDDSNDAVVVIGGGDGDRKEEGSDDSGATVSYGKDGKDSAVTDGDDVVVIVKDPEDGGEGDKDDGDAVVGVGHEGADTDGDGVVGETGAAGEAGQDGAEDGKPAVDEAALAGQGSDSEDEIHAVAEGTVGTQGGDDKHDAEAGAVGAAGGQDAEGDGKAVGKDGGDGDESPVVDGGIVESEGGSRQDKDEDVEGKDDGRGEVGGVVEKGEEGGEDEDDDEGMGGKPDKDGGIGHDDDDDDKEVGKLGKVVGFGSSHEDRGEGKEGESDADNLGAGVPKEGPDTKFAYATWFIVLMCIIIILIIILIIVCLIKRSRGGRYPVQKKEKEAGYDAERDGEAGLGGDFTRTEDDADLLHRSGGSQGSLNGSLKPLESDADSLAAYGDGEGGKFNEDGSFIGQYGPDKKRSNTEWQMI